MLTNLYQVFLLTATWSPTNLHLLSLYVGRHISQKEVYCTIILLNTRYEIIGIAAVLELVNLVVIFFYVTKSHCLKNSLAQF